MSEERIEVGDDGRARLEKDMGLDINPATGRAYESQGDFKNIDLGIGGRFHDGKAVCRTFRCSSCGAKETEPAWGRGVYHWSSFIFGRAKLAICPNCTYKVLALFPNLKGICAAVNGGELRNG